LTCLAVGRANQAGGRRLYAPSGDPDASRPGCIRCERSVVGGDERLFGHDRRSLHTYWDMFDSRCDVVAGGHCRAFRHLRHPGLAGSVRYGPRGTRSGEMLSGRPSRRDGQPLGLVRGLDPLDPRPSRMRERDRITEKTRAAATRRPSARRRPARTVWITTEMDSSTSTGEHRSGSILPRRRTRTQSVPRRGKRASARRAAAS
jgi:hypothetical protein